MPAAGVTDSELSDLVKGYLRGGIVGIVLAVAMVEILVGVALRLVEINDCRFCVLRIESRFVPMFDDGVSAFLLETFDEGSSVGVFREVASSDNIDRELSPRTRESRTFGPGRPVFCGERDVAGPFPTNDNGRLALATSPCRSNWVAVYEFNERRLGLLLVDVEGFRNRGVIAGDCAGVSTAGGKGGGEFGIILLDGVG